ncbi:hypothetical protein HHJ68_04990 [Mobiluncus curtisii]|nr:hypothetical protein [Mobiluncus curtisii]NMW83321.1 hypothetical protein [Mobiluncus curtisii]NMW98462.1 hypothetical protein [Mobiluncus curtisii]NMX05189.1 hypothetical protein [Mobiluncus curtisii]
MRGTTAGRAVTNEITNVKVVGGSKATVKADTSQVASTVARNAVENVAATRDALVATTTAMIGGAMTGVANVTLSVAGNAVTRGARVSAPQVRNVAHATTIGDTTAVAPGRINAVTVRPDAPGIWKSPLQLLGICWIKRLGLA